MVLDTSLTSRRIREVILRREGHRAVCFDDPLEALRFLSRHGPADLLFLRVDLPKMDGYGVPTYLRGEPRLHSTVPIALLRRDDSILVRVLVRLAGAQQVIFKPLVRQRIVELVSRYNYQYAPAQEADQRREVPTSDGGEAASRSGRNE